MIDNTLTDIFNMQTPVNQTNDDSVISIDQMLNNQSIQTNQVVNQPQQVMQETPVENVTPQKKKMDKILIIQISLLIAWAVLTTLIYFFGYDFFEPFIKV